MKKLLLSAFVAFAMLASTKTFAQQGFGTNSPDKSAAVDIISSKRGLLVPRLDLSNITVASPVDAPAHGLLVYNKATSSLTGADVANNVTPGFYYWERNNTTSETAWQGKWVRIVSSNTEKKVVVEEGNNVKVVEDVVGLTTTYTVSVDGGTKNGQVLVSVPNTDTSPGAEPFVSEWVDPDDFIKGVNGINVTTDVSGNTNVGLGGSLSTPTLITTTSTNTLAIDGLTVLDNTTFDPAAQNIVVMGSDGILKEVSPKTLIEDTIDAGTLTAKSIKSSGMITLNGTVADATNTVLKEVTLGIADKSITSDKLSSANVGGVTGNAPDGTIATADGNGNVAFESASAAIGQPLTTDNIIGVGADATAASATTANSLNGAVLTPTYLKIKDDAITAAQIAENAVGASELADNSVASANIIDGTIANADLGEKSVSANKMTSTVTNAAGVVTSTAPANTVPTADGSGGVTYQTIAAAAGEDLTTDGKIVIGQTGATSNSLTDAVLVATRLSISPESITSADILNGTIESADIKDGTIQATDIQAPGSTTNEGGTANQVMVTNVDGDVTWINQTDLPSNTKMDNGINTTVSGIGTTADPFEINVATASGTTLGVVKEATTNPEIAIDTDGSLSINEANVTVGTVAGSDVTGQLNDLTVTGIQGTAVSATAPTAANNMLVFQNGQWEPSTVAAAAGKTLTGAGITVTPGANATPGTATSLAATVLADVTLGIANDAITNEKLADNAVKTENIENGAVTNEDLALKAVTADKMESKNTATGTNVSAGMVPTADGSGGVEYKTINNTVAVINGLRKDATAADVIKLGGDLIEATAINTAVGGAGNTLAITGLANVAPATATKNKVIVAETTGGVLRTVDKIVTGTNVEVAANANYSFHTPEVVINVTLGNTDQTITFPSAASAEGQVINIKIANTTEAHTGYLNVLDTYGAMPYQAWIVKSNGTTWEIVGRN